MTDTKAVVVVADDLVLGLKANIASVLCMSLGKQRPDLIGDAVRADDGVLFPGITRVPVPILTAPAAVLRDLFRQSADLDLAVAFTGAALATKTYADYEARLASETVETTDFHGVLLVGAKKAVNRLAGQLPLLK